MSGTYSIGGLGAGGGVQQIMQLRQQIIQRNDLLQQLHQNRAAGLTGSVTDTSAATPAAGQANGGGFTDALKNALDGVNAAQTRADDLSDAYDRGDVTDTAKVMLARQEASVSFEATLQVRNKLLSAYQDIMRMGV